MFQGVEGYRVSIVGGREAAPHSRPYMASLQIRGQHGCGGVLVREDFVLTAAHCTGRWRVVLGAHSLSAPEAEKQELDVDQFIRHPEYDGSNNDLMLLKLRGRANLNGAVQLIPLMTDPVTPASQCSTAGWGDIGDNTFPDKLQEVNTVILARRECRERWGPAVSITKRMVCATGPRAFQGFCSGDSGGPLVCNGTSAGVVSFSGRKSCADPSTPDVYMKSSCYTRWIQNVLKNN
ncbi:complement factor D-like [Aplochiton taeniatus]